MLNNTLEEKVINLYTKSTLSMEKQALLLHISKPRYKKIIKENFKFREVNNREQAWELYKEFPEEFVYYRYINKTLKQGKVYLLSLALSTEELEELVKKGVPTPKIADIIDMPFIGTNFVKDRMHRLGIKYSKEDAKKNRRDGLEKFYENPENVESQNKKRETTMLAKYGVSHAMKDENIKEKQQQTVMDRFGVPVSTMSKEVQKKQQETSLKNNGVPFPAQNKEIYQKAVDTNIKRYGAKSFLLSKDGKEVARNTRLTKYGYEYTLQSPQAQELVRNAIYAKYGSYSSFSSKEVFEKSRATMLRHYGVEYPAQNPIIAQKIADTNNSRYGYPSIFNIPEVRDKNLLSIRDSIEFSPTKYVDTLQQSIDLLNNKDLLEMFLLHTFPDKKSFTLREISDILGRKYNYVKTRLNTRDDFVVREQVGLLPLQIKDFLDSLGYKEGEDYLVNDRKVIKPLEIDFYFPKEKVGIEVNDLLTHNNTVNPLGGEPKPKNYHMDKSKLCKEKGIRLIHAWEHYLQDDRQRPILQNAIKHALGRSSARVYARNTYVKEVPNISLKEFFNTNNIQGFRGANRAYALLDKRTDEVLMAYSVGSSHFSHHKYDLELIRGASKLDTTIVGGASKLWKYIIDNNPDVNSIVYYIDRNIYSGSSIGSLEGNLELVSTQVGFWNYFPKTGEIKNRQPSKHKEIKELVSQGKVWEIYNAGTETYVWRRG